MVLTLHRYTDFRKPVFWLLILRFLNLQLGQAYIHSSPNVVGRTNRIGSLSSLRIRGKSSHSAMQVTLNAIINLTSTAPRCTDSFGDNLSPSSFQDERNQVPSIEAPISEMRYSSCKHLPSAEGYLRREREGQWVRSDYILI